MISATVSRVRDRAESRRPASRGPMPDISGDPFRQSSLNPPTWRGRLHAAMVLPAVVAGVLLVLATPGARPRVLVALYAGSVVAMFAVSAAFHLRRWGDRGWLLMRRVDHTAIYLLIAASYGAIMGLGVSGWAQTWLVGIALGLTALGIVVRWLVVHPPFGLMNSLFILTGGVSMLGIVPIWRGLGAVGTTVVLIGCGFYGLGALALGARRPNPLPGRFGYHEVWHLNVIAGTACEFCVVAFVIVPSL